MIITDQQQTYTVNASFDGTSINTEWSEIAHQWFREQELSVTTSGSTGEPQQIMLSSKLLMWSAHQTKQALGLQQENVFHCIPLSKIGGLMLFIRSLVFDWNITFVKPSGDPLIELDPEHQHSLISLVPYQLSMILNNETSREKLKRFSTVLIGGAHIPRRMETELTTGQWGTTRFFHSYGMTETASHIALREIGHSDPGCFQLLDGVNCSVDDNSRLFIDISAVSLSITTNDMAEVKGRQIKYLGRLDDVVNSGGLKLHLNSIQESIENGLEQKNISCDFFLWKMPHDSLGEQLVFVGIHNKEANRIEAIISDRIPSVEQPKKYFWIKKYELTSSGKPHRQKTLEKLIEVGS